MVKIAEKVVRYGIYACLFLPLFVGGGFFFFPFSFPKAMAFQIITGLIFPFWLFLTLNSKQEDAPKKSVKIILSPIAISIFVFLAVLFITSLFGQNFQKSLFSTQERTNGIFLLFHFFIFFILLSIFRNKKEWLKLFQISAISSFLVSFSAIYQKFDPTFLGPMPDPKIYGTQGNSLFLSAYLIFNLFLALFLYFNETDKKHRNWWLGIFFTNLLTIFFAASLSAYLALIFGGIALFCLNVRRFNLRRRLNLLYFIVGFLILFCFFLFFYQGGAAFQKLTGLLTAQSSLLVRAEVWKMGIQAFLEKPFFGFGWENFDLVFDKFYDPKFFITIVQVFDRGHNVFVDFLALSGIFGFVSYIIIFILAYLCLKNGQIHQKITKVDFSIFFGLLISYFTINFFNFDTFSSWLMFFLVLGYLNHINKPYTQFHQLLHKFTRIHTNFIKSFKYALVILFVPAILFAQNLNFQSALANFYAYQSIKSITPDEVIENFKKSENYQTFDRASLRKSLADFLAKVSRGGPPEDSLKIYEFFEPLLKENLKNEPKNPNPYFELGIFYRNWGKVDKTKLEEAQKVFKNLLAQNPKKQSSYFLLAQIKTLKKEHGEAISFAKSGVNLYEKSPQSHFYLSLAYLFGGDEINFKKEIQKFQGLRNEINGAKTEISPGLSSALPKKITLTPLDSKHLTGRAGFSATAEYYKEIFEIYWPTKKWQKIIILADEISNLENDPYLHQYLAGIYKELGEIEKAKREAEWIIKNYPELKVGSLRFLKTLETR